MKLAGTLKNEKEELEELKKQIDVDSF
jgi:hypothetical protein